LTSKAQVIIHPAFRRQCVYSSVVGDFGKSGKVISPEATIGRGFECKGNRLKGGTSSPASRNRSRERYLSRQMSAASGGCPRNPSLWQARAPVDVGRSPTETIASKRMGRGEIADLVRRRFRIFKAQRKSAILPRVLEHVAAVRSEGDGQPQLLCGLDKGARLVSRGRAQHEKSSWLAGADHGWPNRCNDFSSRAQPLARCT